MADARQLIVLQGIDTRLDQLGHQLRTLPERAAHLEVVASIESLTAADVADAGDEGDLAGEQKRLEDEVARLRAKIASETARESQITAPRELQAIEAELASLTRRVVELEDRILELMEELEPVVERRRGRRAELDELEGRRDELAAHVTEAEAGLRRELDDRTRQRADTLVSIDPDLLRRYDDLRRRHGGVVVGELDGDRCTACSLSLPPVEAERIRDEPEGTPVPCECGRALIIR